MLETTLQQPTYNAPAAFPAVYRLQSITRTLSEKHVRNDAVIFNEKACLRVVWDSRHVDSQLQLGVLTTIYWLGKPVSEDGSVRISRLVLNQRPDVSTNLFDTVPTHWVKDRSLVSRAREYWELLPRGFQQLFNAIFWDGHRFCRYLLAPSSMQGHHPEPNGNFRHTLEVIDQALASAQLLDNVFRPLLILGGFLHDAGKADEYEFNRKRGRMEMTARGKLIGHKHTVLEWIAVARANSRVIVPETHYLGLLHCLTATKGAAPWMGLREPVSLEATILSNADRISGQADLVSQTAPASDGFGWFHKHLNGRPFVLRELPESAEPIFI